MTEVFIVIKHGIDQYYLMKILRRGLDFYCIPPHLGMHYSVHESGVAHFRFEGRTTEVGVEPPVILVEGEAGIPFANGIIRSPLGGLGRASCICTAIFPLDSLNVDYARFNRSTKNSFVVDTDTLPRDTVFVEIGVWVVPTRNEVSFNFNNPNIITSLLYKIADCEPQIWIYAKPL